MREKYKIGVLIGNIHTSHPKGLIRGISDCVKDEHVDVIFFLGTQTDSLYKKIVKNSEGYDYQYDTVYDYALLAQLDALIIVCGSLFTYAEESGKEELLEKFKGIPYVIMATDVLSENGVHIFLDNYNGMRACIRHLVEDHHYRHICYLSGPRDNYDSQERLRAYRDVMAEHGIPVEENMVTYGNYSSYVEEQVEWLLDHNPQVEAIASANDEMTIAIYRVLEDRGLVPGRDIAVTGFDNNDMAAYAKPPLTTVAQNSYQMGFLAAKKALAICRGEQVESDIFPVELVKRRSCGCTDCSSDNPKKSMIRGKSVDLQEIVDDLQDFQHRAWLEPFIIRDMMMETESEKRFFASAVRNFHDFGAERVYIYLLKEPLNYRKGDIWQCPDALYLAARYSMGKVTVYEPDERPIAFKSATAVRKHKKGECNENTRIYMNFLLFEGIRQYGILSLEIEPGTISNFFMLALLFGTSLRFFEMSKKERSIQQKLKEQNEILSFVAVYDELTGIYNRRGIMETLVSYNKEHDGECACLMIGDLDHLKQINDKYGHVEGDCAIRTAAGILKNVFSSSGKVGRFGGDEFVTILSAGGGDEKEKYIRQVRELCGEYNETAGKPYYLNVSLGATEFICGGDIDFQEMLRHADEFLYEAKKKRRSSVDKENV